MESIIDSMNYSEKVIPQSLRLCVTFFTQMVIAGKCNDISNNRMPPHIDVDDIISYIITLDSPKSGGDTDYCDGISNNMFGVKNYRFRLHIANDKLDVITKFVMACVLGMAIEFH